MTGTERNLSTPSDSELMARSRDGDRRAEEALLKRYEGVALKYARRYTYRFAPLEDLLVEGRMGVWYAIHHFSPARHVKFLTYVTHCVKGRIFHYLRENRSDFSMPVNVAERHMTLSGDFPIEKGDSHAPVVQAVKRMMEMRVVSLEEVLWTASGTATRQVPDPACHRQQDRLTHSLALRSVLQNMPRIKPRQLEWVYLFYADGFSKAEIARVYGVSVNYVSHAIRIAARRITQKLKEFELEDQRYC